MNLHGLVFTHEWVRQLQGRYMSWLHQHCPDNPRLVQMFAASHAFFEKLDASFGVATETTADALLALFGTTGLRKHLLASRFVMAELDIVISDIKKQQFADRDRIREALIAAAKKPWASLLQDYFAWLDRNGVPIRTARLYLSTAASFCAIAKPSSTSAWSMDLIEKFISRHRGLRANLYRFVTFCRDAKKWKVAMPPSVPSSRTRSTPSRTVKAMNKLLREIAERGLDNTPKSDLEKIFAKAFGITHISLRRGDWKVEEHNSAFVLTGREETVEIPPALTAIAKAYRDMSSS